MMSKVSLNTNMRSALRSKQRGFFLNPYRFAAAGGGGGDPSYSSVVLLLQDSLVDGSPSPRTITVVGDAAVSSAQSKFGGSSFLFDGAGDYLSAEAFPVLGTVDFTIEMWVRPVAGANGLALMYGNYPSQACIYFEAAAAYGLAIYITNAGNTSDVKLGASVAVDAGVWYHMAITREAGVFRSFVDGVLKGSNTRSVDYVATALSIGGGNYSGSPNYYYNGNIDDVRITKGVARYTAAFTPPTAAFLDY